MSTVLVKERGQSGKKWDSSSQRNGPLEQAKGLSESVQEGEQVHCPCMSPVPCACAAVVLRYCQLRAASSMAADRYMGDKWWVLEGRLVCDRADFSRIAARMCRILSRDGSVRVTFCKICREGSSLSQSAALWGK